MLLKAKSGRAFPISSCAERKWMEVFANTTNISSLLLPLLLAQEVGKFPAALHFLAIKAHHLCKAQGLALIPLFLMLVWVAVLVVDIINQVTDRRNVELWSDFGLQAQRAKDAVEDHVDALERLRHYLLRVGLCVKYA